MYHFIQINDDGKPYLGYTDGRIVEVGVPVSVEGEIIPCENGLHASERIIDALSYVMASRIALCEVELSGEIVEDDDKSAATARTIVRMLTVEQTDAMLREFARWCALQVIHLWDAPDVVRRYLETGDESLRTAARAGARAAALDAAWDVERATTRAAALAAERAAAWDAAQDAALDAAWDAAQAAALDAAPDAARAAALDAARSAARAAARDAQETKLREMFEAHF